jgi:predicted ribosome quality control (RQC) complex YloA/Tae2 family protein
MVRTIQTTQTNTNYIPPPRQVPVYPVVVEEIPMDLPRIRAENGVILEDSSEEFFPMSTPLAESLAFAAGSSSSAPPAPAVQPLLLEATTQTTLGTMMKMTKKNKKKKRRTSTRKPTMNSRTTTWGYGLSPNIIHQYSRRGTSLTCCKMFCMR